MTDNGSKRGDLTPRFELSTADILNFLFHQLKGDCGAMKMVILITVIESLAVMLAITYFYYRRSQSGKRPSVLRRSGHSHDI